MVPTQPTQPTHTMPTPAGAQALLAGAVRHLVHHPERFPVDKVLMPACQELTEGAAAGARQKQGKGCTGAWRSRLHSFWRASYAAA